MFFFSISLTIATIISSQFLPLSLHSVHPMKPSLLAKASNRGEQRLTWPLSKTHGANFPILLNCCSQDSKTHSRLWAHRSPRLASVCGEYKDSTFNTTFCMQALWAKQKKKRKIFSCSCMAKHFYLKKWHKRICSFSQPMLCSGVKRACSNVLSATWGEWFTVRAGHEKQGGHAISSVRLTVIEGLLGRLQSHTSNYIPNTHPMDECSGEAWSPFCCRVGEKSIAFRWRSCTRIVKMTSPSTCLESCDGAQQSFLPAG